MRLNIFGAVNKIYSDYRDKGLGRTRRIRSITSFYSSIEIYTIIRSLPRSLCTLSRTINCYAYVKHRSTLSFILDRNECIVILIIFTIYNINIYIYIIRIRTYKPIYVRIHGCMNECMSCVSACTYVCMCVRTDVCKDKMNF